MMKKGFFLLLLLTFLFCVIRVPVNAQCSICTKTASQLGEKSALGLNAGIIYLMLAPLAIAGFIGFRWWRREKMIEE